MRTVLLAIYIGVSLAFGKQMIAWADGMYRRVILKEQVAKERISRARRERNGFYRHILAFLIGGALLGAMILWLGNTEQTESLLRTLQLWGLVLVIDGVISISYTVFRLVPNKNEPWLSAVDSEGSFPNRIRMYLFPGVDRIPNVDDVATSFFVSSARWFDSDFFAV
ncbi:hypothetical protein OVA29_10570 [Exiguobacterium sp. SL14]|nr:hypothetical protein [Exiguobacterium sp. SL14]MCY1691061.1 hypothetical protein [Exiguobacterium sp. SL14]